MSSANLWGGGKMLSRTAFKESKNSGKVSVRRWDLKTILGPSIGGEGPAD